MQNTVENFRGVYFINVSGAKPEKFINLCTFRGISLHKCHSVSMVEFTCILPRRYLKSALAIAEESDCEIKILRQKGASFTFSKLKKRYALIIGILLSITLMVASNFYVWDIDVVGNDNIKDSEILNALQDSGVHIGANWVGFQADLIRSEMLSKIPELSFLTVNINGSRATVVVRERVEKPVSEYDSSPCDIISTKSGVVTEVNAFRGNPLVGIGSPVMEGDVLISGVMSGYGEEAIPNFVSAYGEIKARVNYSFTVSESLTGYKMEYTGKENTKYAINFGENRLNLYLSTGIYLPNCDTIYKEHWVSNSEMFTLPIYLSSETRKEYKMLEFEKNENEIISNLKNILLEKLQTEMHENGEIISTEFETYVEKGNVHVTLKAVSVEEIGEKSYQNYSSQSREEISIDAGKNNDG